MNITLPESRLRVSRTILILLLLLCYLPFIGRAFHIDDPLFIWTAKHIQGHPLDFYGFSVNWYGFDEPISLITKNPPLYSYYLAGAAFFLGWSEPAMHIASFLPLLALALGTCQLALQLRAEPFMAAILTACTPVFLLTGATVMCDVTMAALWVWAVYLWLYGLDAKGRSPALAGAAIFIIFAGLTKYFGMALLPLLAIYAASKRLPLSRWLPFLLLPLAVFALYQWGTDQVYGTGLISEAARYSLNVRRLSFGAVGENLLVGLSFAGGSLLTPLFAAPLLIRSRGLLVGGACLALIGTILFMTGTLAGFNISDNWLPLLQTATFILAGGGLFAITLADLHSERSAESLLLALWVLGTFVFAALLNWTVSGRNMLPLAPAAGILISRRLSFTRFIEKPGATVRVSLLLLPLLVISLLLAAADYRWAGEAKKAAALVISMRPSGSDVWFQGHWGFQYYLEEQGGKSLDFRRFAPRDGDIVASQLFGTNIKKLDDERLFPVSKFQTNPLSWIGTLSARSGSFFYSSKGGPLPFSFGEVTPDQYSVEQYRTTAATTGGIR